VIAFIVAVLAAIGGPLQPPAELQTGASRVALAAVTDPRNRPLVDVGADDFVIQEAGTVREVLSVRPADYPIVILVDNGDAARSDFALIRRAVARFIERVGQRPMIVGTYGNEPKMLTTFEDERETILERLDAVEAEAGAGSVLLQAAALAGQTIRPTGALFSAIVVVSAAPEDASRGQTDELVAPIIGPDRRVRRADYRQRRRIARDRERAGAAGRRRPAGAVSARAGPADARRVHGHLCRGVVSGGARPPGRPHERRDDDRVSGAGGLEAERREGGHARHRRARPRPGRCPQVIWRGRMRTERKERKAKNRKPS
jgi:hypothetical protein